MSWLSNLFSKGYRAKFLDLVVKIAVSFLGKIGKSLWDRIKFEVANVEDTDLSGEKKFEQVYKNVITWLKGTELKENILNWLIESAVLLMNYQDF